jgi:hypothetical protein
VHLFVSGYFNEIRIGEVKIIPGNAPREIVTELKCEIEAIKTREGKCIQVIFPKAAIVEPGLILNSERNARAMLRTLFGVLSTIGAPRYNAVNGFSFRRIRAVSSSRP